MSDEKLMSIEQLRSMYEQVKASPRRTHDTGAQREDELLDLIGGLIAYLEELERSNKLEHDFIRRDIRDSASEIRRDMRER